MSLMQYLYSRLLDQMLEKLSDMKWLSYPGWSITIPLSSLWVSPSGQKRQPLNQPLVQPDFKDFQELMFVPSMFPTPMARKLIPGWLSGKMPRNR